MRLIKTIIFVIICCVTALAQQAIQPLATANGRSFTAQDLTPNVAEAWIKLPKALADARTRLLDQQIERTLLDIEASGRDLSIQKLLEAEVSKKVPDPSAEEIQKIYNANKPQLGDTPLENVRPQIVEFLRRDPEKRAYEIYLKALREKYKVIPAKDVNSQNLLAGDVLVTVGNRDITYGEFIKRNGLELYEYEANIFDAMKGSLEQVVESAVFASEAQSLGIPTSEYIAREITSKLKTYSNEELQKLQNDLRQKLYPKYRVRFFINEPKPFIQNISADNDPFIGKKTAKVTVVMFTDYQCPTCASVYPVLKRTVERYGDNVRLVVRDFPLEQIHENAFQAAVAANAANKQRKFFAFKEILYKNQESLDTESLKKYAKEAGLNVKKFEKDLGNAEFAAEVRNDIIDGRKYGVKGTPSIFVNGYKIRNLSVVNFTRAIERALKQ